MPEHEETPMGLSIHHPAMAGTDVVRAITLHHMRVTPRTVWSFVAITLQDGTVGWGEATWPPDSSILDAPALTAARNLTGQSLRTVEDVIAAQGVAPVAQAAVASALEQACWDIRSRQAGLSAAWLHGKPQRSQVRLYANINRRTTDRSPCNFGKSACEAIAAGFDMVKIAPFDDLTPTLCGTVQGRQLMEAGFARVAAACDAVQARAQVFVDCHWRFNPAAAATAVHELATLGVTWFECPLEEHAGHMAALRKLRAQANELGVRTAGLEELTHPEAFRPWLEAGCYDVVMPDVKYAGGIGGVLRVGELAATHDTACAPHNPSGPICHAASLVACSIGPGMGLLEHQFDETPAFHELVSNTLPMPHGGLSMVPKGIGLGVSLNPERWGAGSPVIFRHCTSQGEY
jgi:galactonate dehydratase